MREKAEQDRDVFWYRCDRCQTYCTCKFAEGQGEAECVWRACEGGWTQPREGVHWCPTCSKRDSKPAQQPAPNFVSAAREFLAHADAATGERLHLVVHRDVVEVRLEDGREVMASAGGPVPNNVLAALRLRLVDIASSRAQKQREMLAATETALAALKGEAK